MTSRIVSLLPLSVLIFLIAIFITAAIDNYIETPLINFQTFTNVVTIISSVILLAIGFKLYRRFSSTQSIIDKQTALVIELAVMLSEAKFSLSHVGSDGRSNSAVLNINIHGYKTHLKKFAMERPEFKNLNKKMYIDANISYFLEGIWKLKYDAYLPRRIALLLRNDFGLMTQASFHKNELEIEHFELRPVFIGESDSLLWKPGDIYTIMKNLKNVYEACNDWLREYNHEAYNSLNLISDRMPDIKDK